MARNIAIERKQRIMILAEFPKAKRKDLEDFCDQNGIGFLKIAFDNNEKQGLVFGKYDDHWNSQAHRHVAQQLLSQMEKMSNGGERVLLP